jgi:LPXTG-site transpeptidase (sortase) family protein
VGIQLICLSGWYVLYKKTILSFKTAPVITYTTAVRAEEPVTITIPSVNIALSLTPAQIANGIWQTSDTTATHLLSSARPGENGNIVIYAHNRRHLFGNLKQIKLNDEIALTTSANKVHTYKVISIKEVVPEAIETVLPTDHEVVTVYTCAGWYDQYRLVVKATPQSVQNI